MKKTTRGFIALAVSGALALFTVPVMAAEPPGFETYVVRPGDTLSKIAARVFGDGGRWREILKENPQVTNANKIYPGDSLRVPVPTTAASAAGGASAAASAAPSIPEPAADRGAAGAEAGAGAAPGEEAAWIPELPVETVRSVEVVSPALYRSAGYVADNLPALAIVATEDERVLVATDDAAIVNAPLSPGSRFTVVRADRRIFHPQTGCCIGWLIRVLGTAEITCRGETTSTVVLRGMRDAASIGDYLVPIDTNDTLEENALPGKVRQQCIPPGPGDGVIVAFDEDHLMGIEQEFAYFDRGTASGVTPGRRFAIYRETGRGGLVHVGELQVLRAGESTATALITTSVQEVQVGDLLRAR
jgi:LysM repeat protein